jgi:hypothetical protein
LTRHRPACVWTATVFADLNQYFSAISDEITAVLIAILGYVQTNKSRMFTMKSWMSSAAWNSVSSGLYSNGEFLSYMDRANNPSMLDWCMLPIYGEVGSIKNGRLAAKKDREVFGMFHLSCDPSFFTVCTRCFPYRGRTKPPEPKKKASRQHFATSEHDPQIGSRAAQPVPRDSLLSQASHSSVGSSTSFASMLSAA